MAIYQRTDPLRDFKFKVQIVPHDATLRNLTAGISELGFASVSGISVQQEVTPYREGGMNTHVHKMVGQSDFTPVTFSRGLFANQPHLWKFQTFMHAWTQGNVNGSQGNASDYRSEITVQVFDHPFTGVGATYQMDPSTPNSGAVPGNIKLEYILHNCWPGGFALSDLNANQSSILIQQMTIHHEGFELKFDGAQ